MPRFDSAAGKYIYLKVHGVEYRVYFEQNGKGIPLVCQHTAASDGRQWRHMLNDRAITSKYQVVVPDLPYHGKSLPPESVEWWKEEYRLTKRFLMDFHVEFCRALGLERPAYIGSSMGGHLAVDLALEHPDKFRAVIGMEAGLTVSHLGTTWDWWDHPRISNSTRARAMLGNTGPNSPEKYRREVAWAYGQSAPGIFQGDLYYYFTDHRMTPDQARQIDTSRVAVYLMTGEYDCTTSPQDSQKLAEEIKGAKFVEMKGLGHFPMTEDFKAFKKYLMPVLNEIAGD